ncbi:hypothetical protein J6590_038881 [Homalodisca vitripennis]|nr:hypothetical protein J6590_038881 [Homalodisca vitripennis]
MEGVGCIDYVGTKREHAAKSVQSSVKQWRRVFKNRHNQRRAADKSRSGNRRSFYTKLRVTLLVHSARTGRNTRDLCGVTRNAPWAMRTQSVRNGRNCCGPSGPVGVGLLKYCRAPVKRFKCRRQIELFDQL